MNAFCYTRFPHIFNRLKVAELCCSGSKRKFNPARVENTGRISKNARLPSLRGMISSGKKKNWNSKDTARKSVVKESGRLEDKLRRLLTRLFYD